MISTAARYSISVVIPVFNSASTLPMLASRLSAVLTPLARDYEIILVNDGSRDSSWNTIRELAARDAHVRGADLVRNSGQHNALLCGIRLARFEVVVTMDDDLQNRPEDVPRLVEGLVDADVVYGTPVRPQWGLLRNVASRATKTALRTVMSAETAEMAGAFRAFRLEVRDAFHEYRARFVNIDVFLTWGASRFAAVAVRH